MALEIFRLVGSIFVDNSEADKSIAKTDEKVQSVGQTLAKGIETAGKWGAALATGAAAAVAGCVKLATGAAQTADEIDKMSQKIGISAEGYQEWAYILSQNGMDVDKLQTGLKTLVTQMDAAHDGTAKSVEAFDALGLSIYGADGAMKDQETMMREVLLALADMGEGTERAALANQLFGRSGTELAPLLNQGSEAILALSDRAHDLGLILDEEAIASGVKLTDTIDDMKRSFSAVVTELGAGFFPILQTVAEYLVAQMPRLSAIFTAIAPVLTGLLDGLLPPLMELAEALLPPLIDLIGVLLPPVQGILEGILPVLVELLNKVFPPLLNIVNFILPPLLNLLQPILDLLGPVLNLLDPILALVLSLVDPLVEVIDVILQPLVGMLSSLISFLLPPLQTALGNVSSVLSGTLVSALRLVSSNVSSIKGVFEGLITFITGVFTGNWSKAWEGVQKVFTSYFTGLKEAFRIPFNWIIDGINTFITSINRIKIPNWVPGVGGYGFAIPTIPKLEKGGILEAGQIGLLEGNGAEAVVPLENNRAWTQAVARDMTGALGGEEVTKRLDAILDALEDLAGMKIQLDTGALVGSLADPLDREFGMMTRRARA